MLVANSLKVWFKISLLALLVAVVYSCTPPDERITTTPGQGLRFDADTIVFDTVFTQLRTASRRLKIFNPNNRAIVLERVQMSQPNSPFIFYLNGRKGPLQNLEILGNDSAYLIIEALLPLQMQDTAMIVQDNLAFQVKGLSGTQTIPVLAFAQDAIYYNDLILPSTRTTWTAQKPIVIMNSILVDSAKELIIEAGTRVYNFRNSNILVRGRLTVQGTKERPVRFTANRLEPAYSLAPGQWGSIVLFGPSAGSTINHAIIENGLRGIQLQTPNDTHVVDLILTNSIIRNMAEVGLYSFRGNVLAFNNLIADCGTANIAGLIGGRYELYHNTTGYSGNTGFSRRNSSILFADNFNDEGAAVNYVGGTLVLKLYNNVFSGTLNEEFFIGTSTGGTFDTADIRNNYISSRSTGRQSRGNITFAGAPIFHKPLEYDFHPDSAGQSPLKKAGIDRSTIPALLTPGLNTDFFTATRPNLVPTLGYAEQYP
jgi:hypothetical protein